MCFASLIPIYTICTLGSNTRSLLLLLLLLLLFGYGDRLAINVDKE